MRYRYFFFFLFSFLLSLEGWAKPVNYLGIEHGLSNNTVNVIHKDKFGFMWFGTDDGLNRYDGYEFKIFRNRVNDSTSLVHNQINSIAEDKTGTIWVATRRGLSIFNNFDNNFRAAFYYPYQQKVKRKISVDVLDVKIGKNNTILAAVPGLGVLKYDPASGAFKQLPLQGALGTSISYFATTVQFDSKGKAWVMVKDYGLCMLNATENKLQLVSDKIKSANIIVADKNQQLWIGADNGLFQYTIDNKSIKHFVAGQEQLGARRVLGLNFENQDKLWIATDGGGVNILDLQTNKVSYIQTNQEGKLITSNAVSSLYKDDEARWWIGTFRGGINIIDNQKGRFKTIEHNPSSKNSLINNFAFSFCEDVDGSVWIGTDGGGISVWNRKTNTYKHFTHQNGNASSLSNNNVTSIIRDHENTIWVATYGGGINKFNRATNTFEHYTCNNDTDVWKLYQDKENTLWAGTCSSGNLYRLNKAANKFEVFDPKLFDIITITEDRSGTLWLGSFNQLIKVDKKRKQHEYFNINHPVRAIKEDRYGGFWIGTQGLGLLSYDRELRTYKSLDEEEGLANNTVHTIEEDHHGDFWISTYHGVSKLNPKTKKIKNFFEADGLQSNQFNFNASLRLSTNELLFGGIKGFNIFHPDNITISHSFPNLVVTGIRLFNKPISAEDKVTKANEPLYSVDEITLPYNKAFISIDFKALEFTAPDKISYAYMLEGWDQTWSKINKLQTAHYSNLSEGDYTLRIKSTNAEGVWSGQERVIKIKVLPPWYRSWWAYGFYLLCFFGLFYGYSYYHSKQAKLRYELSVANIKAEKETELNEKKISFFTNVSHEFRTPLTLIINPIKELMDHRQKNVEYQDLAVIYRNAQRLLGLVDQLLLFRKADSGEETFTGSTVNLSSVCEEVYVSFAHQAKTKNIRYVLEAEDKGIEIFADREKLEILLFNLLSNAFKFTPAGGEIKLQVKKIASQVEILVQDSGCGIPAETGNKLFKKFHQVQSTAKKSVTGFGIGLYLVKKFVKLHKGEISYESELNKGTTFRVQLPVGAEYLQKGQVLQPDLEKHSAFLDELKEIIQVEQEGQTLPEVPAAHILSDLVTTGASMLIVEDNEEIRQYIKQIFRTRFAIFEAQDGEEGFALAQEHLPDIIISDIMMQGMSGLELCDKLKMHPSLNHIPIILLTASSSPEVRLKGIEGGAVDYITKPFDRELLEARVESILKSRDNLQQYFYNEITLKPNSLKVSAEHSEFLLACIELIEHNLDNSDFNVKVFAREMGMSHSNLYKRVKDISGRSVNDFMRFIRLRKVAKTLIDTNCKINEAAFQAGFSDIKYFREQFYKLFGMNPSEFVKKYRQSFSRSYNLHEKVVKNSHPFREKVEEEAF